MAEPNLCKIVGFNTDDKESLNSPNVVINNRNGNKALIVDDDMIKSTFTQEYVANQTNLNIITPTEGYRLCIRDIQIVTDANSGVISLDFLTSNRKVGRMYTSAQNNLVSKTAHLVGNINEPLTLNTTTGAKNVFIVITYVEHL